MRDLLIVSGIAGLTVAGWTVTAGEGPSGHGAMHGGPAHGGFPAHMRHVGSHAEQMGIFFPSVPAQQFMNQLPGEPGPAPAYVALPTGDVVVGGAEHMTVGHVMSVAIHALEHVAAHVEQGEVVIPQPGSAGAADSDNQASATAQPNPPIANPAPSRPPGAAGPGRRVFGSSGPGQPGPGRLVSPRW